VLKYLGIDSDYDIYGHSWGAMLAAKHTTTVHPWGLNKLILASGPAVMADWEIAAKMLLATLPTEIQGTIRKFDDLKDYDNEEYAGALQVYYENFVYRRGAYPAALEHSLAAAGAADSYYVTMQGPSELSIEGNLKGETHP
jgi:pimeloyl-ACP methyl ester carboxylesterase